jgi:hypothetical protein
MSANKENWLLIGRGMAGWWASRGGCTSTSYSKGIEQLNKYVGEAAEGCYVVDSSMCDERELASVVMCGPICDYGLGMWEYEGGRDIAEAGIGEIKGFTYVGIGAYVMQYASIGARIGVVVGGRVEWY